MHIFYNRKYQTLWTLNMIEDIDLLQNTISRAEADTMYVWLLNNVWF
jgi:hypothetical protein